MDGEIVTAFVVAAGLGALVGLERQLGREEGATYAGARTFAFYAAWGAAAGYVGDEYGDAAFVVATAGFIALVVAGYVMSSQRTTDWGTTTEAAALVVFAIGVLAWQERLVAAVAIAVGTTALLRAKEYLHGLSERFTDEDVRAVLQFGVITAVVLPLVPNEDLGPFGAFNPFEIWLMVVLVSAIGLVGYLALRLLGERGLGVTGVLGGLISSTAVTLGFSRMSRGQDLLRAILAGGILGASALMYPRVLIEAQLVSPELAAELVWPLVVLGLIVWVAAGYWLVRGGRHRSNGTVEFRNPLTLGVALQFGLLYAAVVFISKAALDRVTDSSLAAVGAVSGINDVDAITLSMANLVRDGLDPAPAAQAVLAAVVVNTAVKGGLVIWLGSRRLAAPVAAVLLPAALVGLAALVLV
jgi:uncharacterized membrane protein (DUF4010 family)